MTAEKVRLTPEAAKEALQMQDEIPARILEMEERNRRAFDSANAFFAAHSYSKDELSKLASAPAATPAPVVAGSDGPAPLTTAPAWSLITSLARAPGYRWPLYQFLKAAHAAGKPCPKARDVLEGWKSSTPPELEVMTDGVKYSDSVGNTKEADLKAIQQTIKALLEK